MNRPNICVISLGCAKNTVDSEVLLGQLRHADAVLVDDVEGADIAVINTCGFIEAAKQESTDAIVEAVERKRQGLLKKVVVMGCLSERYRKELQAELPEVDAFHGTNAMREVARSLGADLRHELLGERRLLTPAHYAYLKISEGCDRPCSFCAIPLMRGAHRSRPLESLRDEARLLVARGVKELIVIAQDTTSYGVDLYGVRRLGALLEALGTIDGLEWLRLLYAYPAGFPRDILAAFRQNPRLCRYLDIPLQHASERVLRSMKRGITGDATRRLLEDIRSASPGMAIRTTFIVGCPTETERDFQVLVDFVKEWKFDRLGVFLYSREEGTAAYQEGDPIPRRVKEERMRILMETQKEISESRNEQLIGSVVRVIVDRLEAGQAIGRTEWDAPEIDQEVVITPARGVRVGTFVNVRINDATEYDLIGEPEPEHDRRMVTYEEQTMA